MNMNQYNKGHIGGFEVIFTFEVVFIFELVLIFEVVFIFEVVLIFQVVFILQVIFLFKLVFIFKRSEQFCLVRVSNGQYHQVSVLCLEQSCKVKVLSTGQTSWDKCLKTFNSVALSPPNYFQQFEKTLPITYDRVCSVCNSLLVCAHTHNTHIVHQCSEHFLAKQCVLGNYH